MQKSALIAVALGLLLGGTSLATAKTRGVARTHRTPLHPDINETKSRSTATNPYYRLPDPYYVYSDPYPTAANPYYRLSDPYYEFSVPYDLAVPSYIPGYSYGHIRMPPR